MLAEEEFAQKRRDEYEEKMRVLLSRTMSDNGGILTKGYSEDEMDKRSVNFFKDLLVLQTKYIDVIRENWGLERDDDTATFGEDFNIRWEHFVKAHLVKDDKGKEVDFMYEDKEGKYRLIPEKWPTIEQLQFVMKNYDKIYVNDLCSDAVELKPSVTIRGIEAFPWSKYLDYLLSPEHEDFYLRQVMILIGELLEVVERNKTYLKEEKQDELFKVLAERVKTIF